MDADTIVPDIAAMIPLVLKYTDEPLRYSVY
jgi:hypothetical protein